MPTWDAIITRREEISWSVLRILMSDIVGMDRSRLGCADDLAQRLHAMERRAGGRQGEAMVEIAR